MCVCASYLLLTTDAEHYNTVSKRKHSQANKINRSRVHNASAHVQLINLHTERCIHNHITTRFYSTFAAKPRSTITIFNTLRVANILYRQFKNNMQSFRKN